MSFFKKKKLLPFRVLKEYSIIIEIYCVHTDAQITIQCTFDFTDEIKSSDTSESSVLTRVQGQACPVSSCSAASSRAFLQCLLL